MLVQKDKVDANVSQKTIVYLGNFGRPDENAAGKRVYNISLALGRLGYKVVLIGKTKIESAAWPVAYSGGVSFYRFPNYKVWGTKKFIQFVDKVIKDVGLPDFIIRYGSPGLAQFDKRLALLCVKRKIKIVADVVDWLPATGGNIFFNLVKTFDTYCEKGIFNCKANGIIAISSYLSEFYKARGCKTVIIPPLVKDYRENISDNRVLKVVYAGIPFRLGRAIKKENEVKDRLDLAVKGVAEVARNGLPVVFDIYGITKGQYLTAYPRDSALVNQNEKSICFHGKASMQVVQNAVNCADFTILLRDQSRATMAGFPTKIVESLSLGTPVITTNTSDLPSYIVPGKNGFFVDISDEDKLVNDLYKVFSCSRDSMRSMKKYCFESRQFCIEKHVDKLMSFFEVL